jgi:hypothetical protein
VVCVNGGGGSFYSLGGRFPPSLSMETSATAFEKIRMILPPKIWVPGRRPISAEPGGGKIGSPDGILEASAASHSTLTTSSSTSVATGAGASACGGGKSTRAAMDTVVTNAAASDSFSDSGARVATASLDSSMLRAEDFLHTAKVVVRIVINYEPTNCNRQSTRVLAVQTSLHSIFSP